jgi:hypothetical protein
MARYRVLRDMIIDNALRYTGQILEIKNPGVLLQWLELVQDVKPLVKTQETKWPSFYRLGIFVTGYCNLNCPLCSQKEFKETHGDMPFEDACKVIDDLKKKGMKPIISIVGGEPTFWPHLKELCVYIKKEIGSDIHLLTNATNKEIVEYLIDNRLIDQVVSNLANCHVKNANDFQTKYGKEIVHLSKFGHIPMPKSISWGTIPADCHCPGLAVMGRTVYSCPNIYSISKRVEKEISDVLFKSMDEDWVEHFLKHENCKYNGFLCQYCPANAKVKREIPDNEKVIRYSRGI